MRKAFIISVLLSFVLSAQTVLIPPRFGSSCAYTFQKIYCYGGKLDDVQYNNDIYALDLKDISAGLSADLRYKWDLVNVSSSIGVPRDEYRYASQFVSLPDGSLFFDGGYNEKNPLVARNATYDPQRNKWISYPGPGYNDVLNGGYRQIYSAAAAYVPDTNSIIFCGGRQLNAAINYTYKNPKVLGNLTYETISKQNSTKTLVESIYGYYNVTELNLDTRIWTTRKSNPLGVNGSPIIMSDWTATYHPGTKSIIYLGGLESSQYNLKGSPRSLGEVFSYDTQNSSWTLHPTNGYDRPTARFGHSATMLSTGNNIIMYGGVQKSSYGSVDGELVSDYVYNLDLRNFTWLSYNKPSGSIGPRAFHSAVLVNGTNLFIMFGKKKQGYWSRIVAANEIMVLNITSMSFLEALSRYPSPITAVPVSTTTVSGLAGGAIAGIVVGSIVMIGLVAAVARYFKKRKEKGEETTQLRNNWDRRDGEHRRDTRSGTNSTNMNNTRTSTNDEASQSLYNYSPTLVEATLVRH
ncbi:uncharacterized protein EV154DRAFT_500389 [Mucor mucedo]|uniref:uncharacterized protein n=1 Tax=Mucor mucedo TaxID=29922 RepID=UPI00221E9A52|nr:uncharacterized protein EV154DRAFT_500389 [Mucor mucedo]KAI7893905.1 hypothetical protein EV154DRAFT_500389 [Mucor mucedo]